jgi:hypothetical protein
MRDLATKMSKMCDVVESWENCRSEADAQLSRLHAEKIRLLVQLDQTLRLLGVNLLAENLYTEDLDQDVMLRLDLYKTIFQERGRQHHRDRLVRVRRN